MTKLTPEVAGQILDRVLERPHYPPHADKLADVLNEQLGQQAAAPPQSDEVSTGQFTSPPMGIIKMTAAPQAAAPTLEAVALAIESALPYSTGARTGWQEVTPERREMVMAAARAVLALPIQQAVAPGVEPDALERVTAAIRVMPWPVAIPNHVIDQVARAAIAALAVAPPPTSPDDMPTVDEMLRSFAERVIELENEVTRLSAVAPPPQADEIEEPEETEEEIAASIEHGNRMHAKYGNRARPTFEAVAPPPVRPEGVALAWVADLLVRAQGDVYFITSEINALFSTPPVRGGK